MDMKYHSARMEDMNERRRPFNQMLQHIAICRDGNQWCVLFGIDLQSGVTGFGDSPYEASRDFDKSWYEKIGNNAPEE